jgi:hypothetical protein
MKLAAPACAAVLGLAIASPLPAAEPAGPAFAEVRRQFAEPPDDARVLMRWWWFGSAVTKEGIERELRLMKEGGIGGVEIQPVYPVALDDPARGVRNLPFLSPEFLEAVRFAADKARELGLRVDMTVGSGWPFGGAGVPIQQAAGRLRVERVKVAAGVTRVAVPDIGAGEAFITAFLAKGEGASLAAADAREITSVENGILRLPAGLEGPHEVLFFVSSRTGMMVKRPALGSEGFVLDHYDRAAIDAYLKDTGDRLLSSFGDHPPYAVFCDSLEVFSSDWTGDLLAEFQKRRGYDLRPHLPALVADAGPKTPAVRRDWGRTLTDLLDERFLVPMKEWSQRHQTRFRIQAYGIPPATLGSSAHADLSDGEGSQWKTLRASRWASSANHAFGRAVTASETWTWLHSPSFRATPLDVKAEADLHFLQGINQLIGHGWPYTPEGVAYPGWRFYAAGVFNEKNPWWPVMPDLSRYLQRLSYLLRQGKPANDVAFYLPNDDAWASFVSPKAHYMNEALAQRTGNEVIARILEAGFNLDFFDDDLLANVGRVDKGEIVLGGNRYRAVVLPNVERIPLATYRKLEAFARAGGLLVATRRVPDTAPGFLATDAEKAETRAIAARLFDRNEAKAHLVPEDKDIGGTLSTFLSPDLNLWPAAPAVGFVRRTLPDAEVYFLANTGNIRVASKANFRVSGLRAEWWDPHTGRTAPAVTTTPEKGRSLVDLELPPYGSAVLVFSKKAAAAPSVARPALAKADALDLAGGWQVVFGAKGPTVAMDTLRSWTESPDTLYFSGIATYSRDVEVSPERLGKGRRVRLDLGEGQALPEGPPGVRHQAWFEGPVREAAIVYVNDQRAGSVFCPPYSVDVGSLLRPGANTIRIEVGNTAINHMAGHALPDYRLLNLRYGIRFEPQDMDKVAPVPSGLLGPVRLVFQENDR